MMAIKPSAVGGRLAIAALGLAALSVLAGTQPGSAATTRLQVTYVISISGLTIGRAQVEGRFTPGQYATAITGSTYGISRFVSDARAVLAGNGRINGTRVVPNSYNLETAERGFATRVNMAMRGGSITSLRAAPGLVEAADRVPVRSSHKRNVVDPVSAFVISLGSGGKVDGQRACNRTLPVFDGWQRFDIRLFFKHTKEVTGSSDAYRGSVVVCGARYVPIAGHRPTRESVQYMADNKRLEVWLAPVAGTTVMVPYRLIIGTKAGDLVIAARQFQVSDAKNQAAMR